MKTNNVTYYTLTREQVLAIATRAAQIAVEQALDGPPPTDRAPFIHTGQDEPEKREMTGRERSILDAIFAVQS